MHAILFVYHQTFQRMSVVGSRRTWGSGAVILAEQLPTLSIQMVLKAAGPLPLGPRVPLRATASNLVDRCSLCVTQ
jgi:hypothetical protein